MTTQPDTEQRALSGAKLWPIVEYDLSEIEIEDDEPVENIESEKQMRLLTEPLYSSWGGPGDGRPFFAAADVGIFYQYTLPPVVPDVLLSLDVRVGPDLREKKHRTYFVWVFGKAPELVVEIASNRKGGELTRKQQLYADVGCVHYVLFDPLGFLRGPTLRVYDIPSGTWSAASDYWFADIGLGLRLWQGVYEDFEMEWLRWCYEDGTLLPTGAERAQQERERAQQERERAQQERERAQQEHERAERAEAQTEQERLRVEQERERAQQERQRAEQERLRAEQERQRAEQERQRAEQLAAQLRALGIDPDGL